MDNRAIYDYNAKYFLNVYYRACINLHDDSVVNREQYRLLVAPRRSNQLGNKEIRYALALYMSVIDPVLRWSDRCIYVYHDIDTGYLEDVTITSQKDLAPGIERSKFLLYKPLLNELAPKIELNKGLGKEQANMIKFSLRELGNVCAQVASQLSKECAGPRVTKNFKESFVRGIVKDDVQSLINAYRMLERHIQKKGYMVYARWNKGDNLFEYRVCVKHTYPKGDDWRKFSIEDDIAKTLEPCANKGLCS